MRLKNALKSALAVATVIAVAGLHNTTRGRNSGSHSNNTSGPHRSRGTATQPPVGTAIQGNTQAVFHNRPVLQIAFGPHSEKLGKDNSRKMRNTDLHNHPYRGGWHRHHGGIKNLGMESNHVPPKQVMSKLDPPWTYSNGTTWSHSNGSAVELDYEDHRAVSTTGSAANPAYLKKLEDVLSDTSRPRNDRMAEALRMEFDDMRAKLAYHNVQEQNDPNYSPDPNQRNDPNYNANPHQRPEKDITRYDEAFKDMIRTCYPNLTTNPILTDALGPI